MADDFYTQSKPPAEVDLDLRIETPENVVLTYRLAGPSQRCVAWLLDLAIRAAIMVAVSIILMMASVVLPGFSVGLLLIVWFLNEFWYFVLCEYFFRGKTIGKHVFGLRVVQSKGYPLTFFSAVLRNFLRVTDSMPFLMHGVGFTSMLATRRFQRLGDLAARTVVIAERRVVLPREPIILEKIEPLNRAEINSRVPPSATLTMIDELLGRRYVLSHERGHAIAAKLAKALGKRLNFTGDSSLVTQYPMAFLAKVYVTFLRTDRDDDDEEIALERRRAKKSKRRAVRAGGRL